MASLTEGCINFRKREENFNTLSEEMRDLESQRKDLEQQSEMMVVRFGMPSKIPEWLRKAETLIKDVAELNSNFRLEVDDVICCGLPNYRSQYVAGKTIAKIIKQSKALKRERTDIIDVDESCVVGHLTETRILVGKAAGIVEEIKKYVTGKEVGTVCVYGRPGSGKTEVVRQVNNLLLHDCKENSEAVFDKVIWLNAKNGSTVVSIDSLQTEIAAKLQIDLDKATGSRAESAVTLASALKKLRFLITLDDMWKELSLEEIGIPRPTKENGCKVIIISRSLQVSSNTKIDRKVEIKSLSAPEAQELFEREANVILSQFSTHTQATAHQILDTCDCLPSTIIELAKILKELTVPQHRRLYSYESTDGRWQRAFRQLIDSSALLERMHRKAFASVKYSYDMLTKEAQQCFLYCALYPSGHYIEKEVLVEYWFWEGLLDGTDRSGLIEDMPQAREILDELIRAYLLYHVVYRDGKKYIRMRPIVWHMAVDLTKTSPQFLIKAGEKLTRFPWQGGDWSEVERASLMINEFKALTEEPMFPKLSTLLLQNNPISYLHENFFDSMPNIKLLDLSHTDIPSLPNSTFSNLRKLRAILLRSCRNLKFLPSLAKSVDLLVLDLSDTPIEQLPDGMENLTNLIRLNLSRTNVGGFQVKLVHALPRLEELLMITNESSSWWGSTKGLSIEELGSLRYLSVLHVNFVDAEAFDTYVESKQHSLSKFKFCVGGTCTEILPENNIVFIKSKFLVKGKPVSLPEDTSELHVMSNNDLVWLQVTCRLKSLKVIKIFGCQSLVYLFKIDMLHNLPNLESICVDKCQEMEALIESEESDDLVQLQVAPCLKELQFINISDCENLVYLFRIEMLQWFPRLQKISISQRRRLEVEKESKKPNHELLLVDPLELNKTNMGEMTRNLFGTIWNFPKLKMRIITSSPQPDEVPPRESHENIKPGSSSGDSQMQQSNSIAIDAPELNSFAANSPRRETTPLAALADTPSSSGSKEVFNTSTVVKPELAIDHVANKLGVPKGKTIVQGIDGEITPTVTSAMAGSSSGSKEELDTSASDCIDQEKQGGLGSIDEAANKIISMLNDNSKILTGLDESKLNVGGVSNMVQSIQSFASIAQSWGQEIQSLMSQVDKAKTNALNAEKRALEAESSRVKAESNLSDLEAMLNEFHARIAHFKTHSSSHE